MTPEEIAGSLEFIMSAFERAGMRPGQLAGMLDAFASDLSGSDALKKYFLLALCMKRVEVSAARTLGVDTAVAREKIFASIDGLEQFLGTGKVPQ